MGKPSAPYSQAKRCGHTIPTLRRFHVWVNHDNDLVDLTITKTAQGTHDKATKQTSEVIHTNKKHPFLTVEQGFLPVGQLTLGMHIVEADGHAGVITGWKLVAGAMTMYNLEVAHDHTFVVGVGQWVVHNCGYSEKLLSNIDEHWHPGSYSSAEESFTKHFAKHGEEVGASTAEQYMNKALGFQQNLRRAASKPVDGFVKGAQRFIKLGKYIDVAPDERIISFGTR